MRYCSWNSNIQFISSRHRVISSIYSTNRFHVAVRPPFSDRSQMTSKCGSKILHSRRYPRVSLVLLWRFVWRYMLSVSEQKHCNMDSVCFIKYRKNLSYYKNHQKYSCSSAISTLEGTENKRRLQTLSIDNAWSKKNFCITWRFVCYNIHLQRRTVITVTNI